MELQYRFPLTPQPYLDVARRVGIGLDELQARLERYRAARILKKVGFNIHYQASRKVAALVAVAVDEPGKERLRRLLLKDREVTHNYVRRHERYQVWFVIKRPSIGELEAAVADLARVAGVEDYLILLGKRTYKLAVKYDLWRGVSWAPPEVLPEAVPTFEELGLERAPFTELARGIPVVERPYRAIAARYGYREEELVDLLGELYRRRVVRNLGATLWGHHLGFNYDGMVVFDAAEAACRTIALQLPEATHVVYRVPLNGEWRYPVYFMAHADSPGKVEAVAARASRLLGDRPYQILYSIEDLKPGLHSSE
jgi:DNA-binding Lrp family transcriptional regulator